MFVLLNIPRPWLARWYEELTLLIKLKKMNRVYSEYLLLSYPCPLQRGLGLKHAEMYFSESRCDYSLNEL